MAKAKNGAKGHVRLVSFRKELPRLADGISKSCCAAFVGCFPPRPFTFPGLTRYAEFDGSANGSLPPSSRKGEALSGIVANTSAGLYAIPARAALAGMTIAKRAAPGLPVGRMGGVCLGCNRSSANKEVVWGTGLRRLREEALSS